MAMASPPAIEKLRSFEVADAFRPTLPQLRSIVDGLVAMRPLDAISAATGLDSAQVLQVVSDLGSWLAKSKGGFKGEIACAGDLAEMPLPFQLPSSAKAGPPTRRSRKRPAFSGVVIPRGFERSSSGRDLDRSLASIVYHKPSDDVLARFSARVYTTGTKELTHYIVATVHLFARFGRLGELAQAHEAALVADENAARDKLVRARRLKSKVMGRPSRLERWLPFANGAETRAKARLDEARDRLYVARHWYLTSLVTAHTNAAKVQEFAKLAPPLVQAYDLLEVARQDAVAAVATILESRDLEVLRHAAVKLRVLDGPSARRIEQMLDLVDARPESMHMLERELRYFAKRVAASPSQFRPASIGELSPPQVKRICANAGLKVEVDTTERAFEQKLRTRLRELGLEADADRLVPAGLDAFRNGRDVEFLEALAEPAIVRAEILEGLAHHATLVTA